MGAGEHRIGLGRPRPDHPDLDVGLWRYCHPGSPCGHRGRDPAVPYVGVGAADDTHAAGQAARSDPADAFYCGHLVGGMLSPAAAGAARAPRCIHQRPRNRVAVGLPHGDDHRLRVGGKPAAAVRRRDPAAHPVGIFALDRAQLPPTLRRRGAGARARAVSAGIAAAYRRRHPDQRRVRGQHRLCAAPLAGARMNFIGDGQALLVLVLAGFLPNEVWRMLGLWLGGGVDEGSELLVWVRAVATAILAGVIAQILVFPPGALSSVPAPLRYGAVAAGFAVFVATRRSIFAGVVCGEMVMLAGTWWLA